MWNLCGYAQHRGVKIMTDKDIEIFEKVYVQLQAIHNEISILSKKTPDGAINTFKLQFVNQLLEMSNQILVDDYVPLVGFKSFDSNNMPTNSDIVFVVSQYLESFDRLKSNNVIRHSGKWHWIFEDEKGRQQQIETSAPAAKYIY